ncbi:hypothetical protein ASG39_20295 [Rhizobium sp. Leaf371]|uniref:hypothetical protein n=1 Tax=Rhizobium sp. Leaf371 TaxID=1736355 RepID=UPI000713A64C|nr:hypothetical protein [Rhizobium sp. Leaf371]KQS71611.1 hypothetical protein ASG39_20295 [Rhizobium sp. Leaf371]
MVGSITVDLLERVAIALAAREWSTPYLAALLTDEGSGVVSGAQEHFTALNLMSQHTLGDIAVPPRFCNPDALDD